MEELREICDGVGREGFGAEQYIRAGELFLAEEVRCKPYDEDFDWWKDDDGSVPDYDPESDSEQGDNEDDCDAADHFEQEDEEADDGELGGVVKDEDD